MGLAALLIGAAAGAHGATEEAYSPLRVEMRAQAQVRGARVTLGEVADLSSPNLSVLKSAMHLPMGPAPRIGETGMLERDRVERWLRSRGIANAQVFLGGAPTTAVTASGHTIPSDEVVAVARNALMNHLSVVMAQMPATQLDVQLVAAPGDLDLPDGAVLAARPLGRGAFAKHMLVWVDASADRRFLRSVAIRFEVSAFSVVPVATGGFEAGKVLQAADIDHRRVDIAKLGGGNAFANVNPGEQSLRHQVRQDEPIAASNLQQRPAVSRGDWVTLMSHQGMVTLESRVEVLQDGRPGQMVRVRQGNATGHVIARVVGPGQVEMHQ